MSEVGEGMPKGEPVRTVDKLVEASTRESTFDVSRRTFAGSQIFVGAPYMNDEDAYRHAKHFGLTSGKR